MFSCKEVATYMLNKMNKAKFKYIKNGIVVLKKNHGNNQKDYYI